MDAPLLFVSVLLVSVLVPVSTRKAWVDDVSSDSPSAGVVDADASDRGVTGVVGVKVGGNVGDGDGAGAVTGGAEFPPPTVTWGVVIVTTGAVTVAVGVVIVGFGTVTVATGVVTTGAGLCFGARRSCHFAFHPASAARSRPLNPFGAARVGAPLSVGPLNPFVACEALAVARYSPAAASAYGCPFVP